MKILLTGEPGIGKTTVVRKVLENYGLPAGGFYTGEIREGGRRVGFEIATLDGDRSVLAHRDFAGRCRVGRYGVDVGELDRVGVASIEEAVGRGGLVVVDEVGRMELFSKRFATAVLKALDSGKPFLGTIMKRRHPFADGLKVRDDVVLIEVTHDNRDSLPAIIVNKYSHSGRNKLSSGAINP